MPSHLVSLSHPMVARGVRRAVGGWLLVLLALVAVAPASAATLAALGRAYRPVNAGATLNGTLQATVPTGATATFSLVSAPAKGTVTVQADGSFSYAAAVGSHGADSFTFQVSDGTTASAAARVWLTINGAGAVTAVGDNSNGQTDVGGWNQTVAVAAGQGHTLGLNFDGTAVATGRNDAGQTNVSTWSNLVQVAGGWSHSLGLKSDGTVVAVGDNSAGQLAVSGWSDIVAVSGGGGHSVGLKSDGTVIAVGQNHVGQTDVSGWSDIVAISAGVHHTVGLKSDGTVVATGRDDYGQTSQVSSWSNIVAVAAGFYHTVGLKGDGTVVAVGDDSLGQTDVSGWTDIVAVVAGVSHTVGLKADGTVVATGDNGSGQTNTGGWTQAMAVAAGGGHTVALTAANLAPKPVAETLYVEPGQSGTSGDLLANDFDPNGDALTLIAVDATSAQGGSVVLNGAGGVDYTPPAGFTGTDSFSYTVEDPAGLSATATVTVVVTADWDGDGMPNLWETASGFDPRDLADAALDADGDGYTNLEEYRNGTDPKDAASHINTLPVAGFTVVRPVIVSRSVSATLHATDKDHDPLTFTILSQPAHGSVVLDDPATGAFTYTARGFAIGGDSFTFQVSDGVGPSAPQTVHLQILQRPSTTVASHGSSFASGEFDVGGWTDMVQLAGGGGFSLGLRSDGTVAFAGTNASINVGDWHDIVAIAACNNFAMGLRADGTVVATGTDAVSAPVASYVDGWRDIVAIAASDRSYYGLRSDGTVVAASASGYLTGVSSWSSIVALSAGVGGALGLKSDGTAVAVGSQASQVGSWSGLIAVAQGETLGLGLRGDGTVVAAGYNYMGDLNVSGWRSIAIAAGKWVSAALQADGSVVLTGDTAVVIGNSDTWRDVGTLVVVRDGLLGLIANLAPVAADVYINIPAGAAGTSANLIALGSDANGDTLTLSGYTQGAHGTVTDNGDGTLTYTKGAGFTGTDSFTYILSDGYDGNTTATVRVTTYPALGLNDADGTPIDGATIRRNGVLTFAPTGGSGGYIATASANASGVSGTLIDNHDGSWSFKPGQRGAFAGDYVIAITDAETGVIHTFTVSVPPAVAVSRPDLLGRVGSAEVTVRGLPAGTAIGLDVVDANGAGVNGIDAVIAAGATAANDVARSNAATVTLAAEDVATNRKVSVVAHADGFVTGQSGYVTLVASATFSGYVVDNYVRPLSARVAVKDRNDAVYQAYAAQADSSGRFTLVAPKDAAVLVAGYANYDAHQQIASNCMGDAHPCTFTLSPATGSDLLTGKSGVAFVGSRGVHIALGLAATPVVIAGVPGSADAQSGVVRVSNVDSGGFDLRFQEWAYEDRNHPKEEMAWLALAPGRYHLPDGSVWEVGSVALGGTGSFHRFRFGAAFAGVPRLFLTVQSDNGPDAVTVRARNVNATGFSAALFEEEAKMDWHANETVGYLAIYNPAQYGRVAMGGSLFDYNLDGGWVNDGFTPVLDGYFDLRMVEEQSLDTEGSHAKENVDLLLLRSGLFGQDVSSRGLDTAILRQR